MWKRLPIQLTPKLTVRYTKLGEDVGHYDSLVCSTAASVCITPMILSPLPKIARTAAGSEQNAWARQKRWHQPPTRHYLQTGSALHPREGGSKWPAAKRELAMKRRQTKVVDEGESWFCFMCGETRQENMVRCCGCKQWVHVACAGDPHSQFRCDDCDQV